MSTFAQIYYIIMKVLHWLLFLHPCPRCRSVSTIRNERYHIHANLSFAILVAEILLLISARFEPGTVSTFCSNFNYTDDAPDAVYKSMQISLFLPFFHFKVLSLYFLIYQSIFS